MRRCVLAGSVLSIVACRGPAPEQPAAERTTPQPALDVPQAHPTVESTPTPPDRFSAFFTAFCDADDTKRVSMLAPNFVGQALFVAGGQDPSTAHEAAGLIAVDVGTRIIVPTFPMCEAGAEPTYDIADDGQGTATIGGRAYRVGLTLEPLQLTHLLLKLPPDPTADAPPPPQTTDVFISTMQVDSSPVSVAVQRRLETFLVAQRGCVDAYAATTDDPVGASVDLVVPVAGPPYLSARTVAELGVLACFEARLGEVSWDVETEARLLLHYGVPTSGPVDGPTLEMIRAD